MDLSSKNELIKVLAKGTLHQRLQLKFMLILISKRKIERLVTIENIIFNEISWKP
jgi:hypothetical protein